MPYGTSVLIVEDDASARQMLIEYLGDHEFEVRGVEGGPAMREAIDAELPDLVLLDLRLPGEDGFSLARYLRENFDVAIIMVTGLNDVVDRVVGLEGGADDYVTKPFDPRELMARIRSVLRRRQVSAEARPPSSEVAEPADEQRVRVGRCWLAPLSRRLLDEAGAELSMTAMEYDLLQVFVANPNRVLSRDQLLMRTRNREWEPSDRSIDIRIGRLRRKVEAEPGEPRTIRTVRNVGYMYVPD